MKINRRNIEFLVEVLRDEELPNYQDITKIESALSKGSGEFCVWGVGCELYGLEKGIGWRKDNGEHTFLGEAETPPDDVQRYFGISNDDTIKIPAKYLDRVDDELHNTKSVTLIELNDETDLTFPEMADVIEYTYLMTEAQRKKFDKENPPKIQQKKTFVKRGCK